MKKGQIQNLTGFGLGLLICGIVLGLTALVLANFNIAASPNQLTTVTNSTTTVQETAYKQVADVWVTFADDGRFGQFVNGSLTIVVNATGPANNASAMTANLTIKVNSNVIGSATGYNTSGTMVFALTAAQLVNGKNNVSYYVSNTSDVSSTSILFDYITPGAVSTTSTVTSVINTVTNLTNWIPIVIIVFVVALILTLLGMSVGRRTEA